ncbi:MAG: hypothetical protein SVV80_02335 [Planctomycetota bacterium]|nr:hypothetical protein [Planctomycetota bacterium]
MPMQTIPKTKLSCLLFVAFITAVLGGCGQLPPHPPQTMAEFLQHQRAGNQDFPPKTIALHNAHRVLNDGLSADERLESLRVLERVDIAGEQTYPTLAIVLTQTEAPPRVRRSVLAFLAERDCPGLAEHIANVLPQADDPQLRSALLEWLHKNPARVSLVSLVKLWAAEKPISDESEMRYRQLVERTSGQSWSDALLEGLNTPKFFARGSAIEILSSRLGTEALRRKISSLSPRTQAVGVLKYFSEHFGYAPKTRRELLSAVILHRKGAAHLAPAERLVNQWRNEYDYRFRIRDFHLISRLAADPLRKSMSRAQMILEISQGINKRRAVRNKPLFRRGRLVDFASQTESLSVTDLWNLMLISEMLDRPRFRRMLMVTARQDMADRLSQCGGLIVYEEGQAEAKLYLPAEKRGDDQYVPSQQMLKDTLDSLCYFVGHFSTVAESISRIGPGEKELASAANYNVCGVVFTTISGGRLNVTYFTPEGIVVDLGNFGD